jgi:hypothetical protein
MSFLYTGGTQQNLIILTKKIEGGGASFFFLQADGANVDAYRTQPFSLILERYGYLLLLD